MAFCNCARVIAIKHCVKVDRTLGKLLLGTKVSFISFQSQNLGVQVAGLNCV